MAVPSCRGGDESDKRSYMMLRFHKGYAFFYQDDLLDELVMR